MLTKGRNEGKYILYLHCYLKIPLWEFGVEKVF